MARSVLIWTTTPWTIPGNRAISYSSKISYGLYEVTRLPRATGQRRATRYILADKLADDVMKAAQGRGMGASRQRYQRQLSRVDDCRTIRSSGRLATVSTVPLLEGDHVTDEDGTGFVHTAPGHGREDFEIWMANAAKLAARGIDTAIPFTVDGDGRFTKEAPGFEGKRVIDDKGNKGDANDAVIKALVPREAGRADRPRPPQAPVSALLALQEAGDLPQHAAVVHRHGQAAGSTRAAPPGARRGAGTTRRSNRAALTLREARSRPSKKPNSSRPPGRTGCAA